MLALRGSAPPTTILALLAFSAAAALLVVYFLVPLLWLHLLSVDDSDPTDSTHTLVASRNPFRETGPPANMAKLILLRHKIQTTSKRRRSFSHSRQVPRTFNRDNASRAKAPWMRMGKAFGGAKQFH